MGVKVLRTRIDKIAIQFIKEFLIYPEILNINPN